jgi:hypothetical protein
MGETDEVRDSPEVLPSIEELRRSQHDGGRGRGLPQNKTGKLNEVQGHEVDIRE